MKELQRQVENKHLVGTGVGAAMMLAALLIGLYLIYFHQPRYLRLDTNKNLLFLSMVLIAVCVMVKISAGIGAHIAAGDNDHHCLGIGF